MKKILLLIVAVLFSVTTQAQLDLTHKWAGVLRSDKTTGSQGTNSMSAIIESSDNNLIAMGNFGSFSHATNGDFKYAVFNHYDANGVLTSKNTPQGAFPNNINSVNRDFLLYKMNKAGEIIWQLTSDRGDFDPSNSSVAATPDGGAVLALKLRHVSDNLYNDNLLIRFIENDGNQYPVEWTYPTEGRAYQGVLAKVSSDGKIVWAKLIPVDYIPQGVEKNSLVSDAINFGGLAVDASSNIYLAGRYAKTVKFKRANGDEVSLTPQNTVGWDGDSQKSRGDMLLVKLDANGNFLWNFTSNGIVTYQGISDITLNDNKLYIYGNIQGDDVLTTVLGSTTIRPTAKIDCYNARIDVSTNTPTVDWAKHFTAIPLDNKGGRNKITTINYSNGVLLASGSVNAIIGDADRIELNSVTTANSLRGFIIKQDPETGNVNSTFVDKTAVGLSAEIEQSYYIDNKIYAHGYVMGANYIYDLPSDLSSFNRTQIVSSGSATTQASTLIDNTLFSIGRGQGQASILKAGVLTNFDSTPAYSSIFAAHEITEITTGISEDTQTESFIVYGGKNQITIVSSEVQSITIYNLYGQIAKQQFVEIGENTIDNLASGVYIVNKQKVIVR